MCDMSMKETPIMAFKRPKILKYLANFFGEYWSSTKYPKNRIVECPENIESPQYMCLLLIESPIPEKSVNARLIISYVDVEFDLGL